MEALVVLPLMILDLGFAGSLGQILSFLDGLGPPNVAVTLGWL